MATTYSRIRALLSIASRRAKWQNRDELIAHIHEIQPSEFLVRGDIMTTQSLRRLVELTYSLELFSIREGVVEVTTKGRNALETDESYSRQIRSSVKTALETKKIPLEDIETTIAAVELPEVPDSPTIYRRMADAGADLSGLDFNEFRTLLFLLASAGGINRLQRVHYQGR